MTNDTCSDLLTCLAPACCFPTSPRHVCKRSHSRKLSHSCKRNRPSCLFAGPPPLESSYIVAHIYFLDSDLLSYLSVPSLSMATAATQTMQTDPNPIGPPDGAVPNSAPAAVDDSDHPQGDAIRRQVGDGHSPGANTLTRYRSSSTSPTKISPPIFTYFNAVVAATMTLSPSAASVVSRR